MATRTGKRCRSSLAFFLVISLALLDVPGRVVRAHEEDEEEVVIEESPAASAGPSVISYTTPDLDKDHLPYKLYEHFDDESAFTSRWIRSKATKSESEEFQYDGEWGLVPSHTRVAGESHSSLVS